MTENLAIYSGNPVERAASRSTHRSARSEALAAAARVFQQHGSSSTAEYGHPERVLIVAKAFEAYLLGEDE